MNKLLFFYILFLISSINSLAQTNLEKGDIVVVGVNAETTSCYNNPSNIIDAVYILALKNITNGTIIDVTDNAWQRNIDNRFSKNEGTLRFTRTGGTIAAGTIFQINFTTYNSNTNTYNTTLTNNNSGWDVSTISISSNTTGLNFAVNGDQLLFMTDGAWNNGNGNTSNAQYNSLSGKTAKILFGYNSKNAWNNLNDDSGDSALPGDESNDPSAFDIKLHHYTTSSTVTNATRRYQNYNGPWTLATKEEWYMRVLNPSNWIATEYCNNFNNNLSNSPIQILTSINEIIVCKDDIVNLKVDSNSIVTYQWYSNDENSTQGGTLIAGANSATFNPPTSIAGTKYYYCIMKYTLRWRDNSTPKEAVSESIYSLVYKVTVNQIDTSSIQQIP